MIDFQDLKWWSTSLLHSGAYQYSIAKVTSSQTLYSVRDRWETLLLFLEEQNPMVIRKPIISKIWIELMVNSWNLSGKIPRISIQWESWNRSNRWWENYDVNQRISQQDNLHINVWRYCMWFKGSQEICENNSKTIQQYVRRFFRGHWVFLGLGSDVCFMCSWFQMVLHLRCLSWFRFYFEIRFVVVGDFVNMLHKNKINIWTSGFHCLIMCGLCEG